MQRVMLKSKIHRATVTDCDLHYVGSITIDPELLEAADILEHEQVHVVDVDNGARFETYTIAGRRGSGDVKVNGAAARLVHRGDTIIVISYGAVRPCGDGALRASRGPCRGRHESNHHRRRRGGDPAQLATRLRGGRPGELGLQGVNLGQRGSTSCQAIQVTPPQTIPAPSGPARRGSMSPPTRAGFR